MLTALTRTLQLVAISVVLPYVIHAEERNALATLIDASAQRLSLAKDVALAKWDNGAPVEDLARERHVIDTAIAAGRKSGLPAEFVSRFFSAQIEANKVIQYALLTDWQGEGKAPPHSPINLAQNVRPQIDRIQALLISALVNQNHSESRASCRAQLAKAIQDRKATQHEISDSLFATALDRALGPLCDAVD